MNKFRQSLLVLALSAPLAALAAVPVYEGSGYTTPSNMGAQTGGAGGSGAGAPLTAQAELFMQLQQMQEELSALRGLVEEQQYQIQQLKQENLERYQMLEGRLGAAPAVDNSVAQNPNAGSNPDSSPAPSAPAAGGGDPEQEKLFYDAAFDLIKARDFDKAKQAFNGFLRKYPDGQYSANAQYWLGEVNLSQGDLENAGKAFAQVIQSWPKHNKVPDAMYKLATVENRLGRMDRAKTMLKQVVAQYPSSSAAQLAQRDLRNL